MGRCRIMLAVAACLFAVAQTAYVARSEKRAGVLRKALVVESNISAVEGQAQQKDLVEELKNWGMVMESNISAVKGHAQQKDLVEELGHGHGHGHGHDDHGHAEDSHGGHGPSTGAADHGGHTHAHVEHYDPVAGTIATMLFGTVAWVISMFYFVNWPDSDIQKATWTTLSDMIAIFSAVLLFSATTRSLQDFAGGFGLHHHGQPPTLHLVIAQIRFWVLFLLLQAAMIFSRQNPWMFKYMSSVGCHIVGFGAIDAFGHMLHMDVFSSNIWMSVLGVVGTGVFLYTIFALAAKGRDTLPGSRSWRIESVEAESDAIALALGLLVSMLFRFAISGHLPPVHGAPRDKTTAQCWMLFGIAFLQGPMVVGASVLKHRVKDMNLGIMLEELIETSHATVKMSMGWTLLFWGYWCFYNQVGDEDGVGGKIGQRVTMAVVFSAIVFAAILIIDKVADTFRARGSDGHAVEHGFRALLSTFALLMGLAWEATFVQAVHAVSLKYHGVVQMYVVVGVTTALCCVVLPAWALYILPNAMHEPEKFYEEFLSHEAESKDLDTSARHEDPAEEARD